MQCATAVVWRAAALSGLRASQGRSYSIHTKPPISVSPLISSNRIPENYQQGCGLLVASLAKRLCTKQNLLRAIVRNGRVDGAAGCWDNRTAPLTSHYNYKSLNTKEVPTALTCERGGCTPSQHCRASESKNIAIGFIRIQVSKV